MSVLVLWVLPLYVFKINSEAKRFAVGVEYASFVNTLTLTLVLLAGATMVLSMVEVGLSTVDALYLVVMTFTTIGYSVPFDDRRAFFHYVHPLSGSFIIDFRNIDVFL